MTVNEALIYPTPPGSPLAEKTKNPEAEVKSKVEPDLDETFQSGLCTPPASPRKYVAIQHHEESISQSKTQPINVDDLRRSLEIDLKGRRCGGLTQKGSCCRRFGFSEGDEQDINRLIESMLKLTRDSPDLPPRIAKLVKIVSCWSHDSGKPRNDRISAWMKVFPVPDGGLDPLKKVDYQIREFLNPNSVKCAVEGCDRLIGGRKVLNCWSTIDKIANSHSNCDIQHLCRLLEVLGCSQYCGIHTEKYYHTNVKSRRTKIVQIWSTSTLESSGTSSCALKSSVDSTSQITKSGTEETEASHMVVTGHAQALSNTSSTAAYASPSQQNPGDWSPFTFWPEDYDDSPFDIQGRGGKINHDRSVEQCLQKVLQSPLKPKDQKEGYIYLYEVKGNANMVKLGWTSRSLRERHDEWAFECNREPKSLYPLGQAVKVPNAARVEELCHAELDNLRFRHYCKACLKQHFEWFEVDSAIAIAVIEKWSEWMRKSPYGRPLRSGQRFLESNEFEKTKNMKDFL